MSTSVPESSTMKCQHLPQTDIRPSSISVNEMSAAGADSPAVPTPSTSQTQLQTETLTLQSIPVIPPVEDRLQSPSASPQVLVTSNTTSTISSVDEEVPTSHAGTTGSLLPESSSAVLQSQDFGIPGRKPSVSSLNPSSSRFMLRIPLLGRPKLPLDQAVASANSGDLQAPSPLEAAAGNFQLQATHYTLLTLSSKPYDSRIIIDGNDCR